jgi:type IV secretory pathway VirB2 component (pilin)
MESETSNANLLKYARWMVIAVIVLTLSQASTGLSQNYGSATASSHALSAQLGLVACIVAAVLVVMSKTDNSKLKGMTFGLATAWLIQYGMGEMFASMTWIAHLHAVIAMGILLHATALLRAFPAASDA